MIQNRRTRTKSRKLPKKSVSAFISKTYEILEDNQFPDIVDWNLEGTAIVIKKPTEFAQKVLSIYFKHKNLTSFVRQLNMYNFHKQRTHKIEHVYSHELFQRDKKYLLEQIKRKNQDQLLLDSDEPMEEPEPIDPNQDLASLLQEKQALKRFNMQASTKINNLEGKIQDLLVQNQGLKDQIAQQDERDKILLSLMANILKKYGIPPTELSSIMKEGAKEQYFQDIKSNEAHIGLLPLNLAETSANINIPGTDVDVGNYLNLDGENGGPKQAATTNNAAVLNNRTNSEERAYARDVSPVSFYNKLANDLRWEQFINRSRYQTGPYLVNVSNTGTLGSNEQQKEVFQNPKYKPQLFHDKEMMNNYTKLGNFLRLPGNAVSSLGKRGFEEGKEGDFGEPYSLEVLKKRMELNPVKLSGESRSINDLNDLLWKKTMDSEVGIHGDYKDFRKFV